MGLAVGTHSLAYAVAHDDDPEYLEMLRNDLRAINVALAAEGIAAHTEPEVNGGVTGRATVGSVPYSFVHHLRRAYAWATEYPGRAVPPVAEGERASEDSVLEQVGEMFESHLLCHSDCEGYYVPVDFADVVFSAPELEIPGCMVGSSQALLRELVYVAPYLGITLVEGELSDAEIARVDAENGDDEHPLYRERETWLLFYEAARVSVANRTVISFG
ncbi:hypothetical protein JK358_29055 [Nocardia sp. 2]|uniref:DUF5753 domain-containing protein n=1 Tax=Nocardia acididurans TaxID=2802282 RepID=A0ABS1MCT0_9NOCA|nr:hypothetical protein [Nocardia acididurans]MBL1078463.1 hypothetical protein [Nocardia acididurans]